LLPLALMSLIHDRIAFVVGIGIVGIGIVVVVIGTAVVAVAALPRCRGVGNSWGRVFVAVFLSAVFGETPLRDVSAAALPAPILGGLMFLS